MAENVISRRKGVRIDARKDYPIPTDSENSTWDCTLQAAYPGGGHSL